MKAIVKLKSFEGHKGIPGHQGGSLPKDSPSEPPKKMLKVKNTTEFTAVKVGDRVVVSSYSTLQGKDIRRPATVTKVSGTMFTVKYGEGTLRFYKADGKQVAAPHDMYSSFHQISADGIVIE